MLYGQQHVHVRPVRESDLDALYAAHIEIRNRHERFRQRRPNQDVLLYSLLKTDPRPWRESGTAAQ